MADNQHKVSALEDIPTTPNLADKKAEKEAGNVGDKDKKSNVKAAESLNPEEDHVAVDDIDAARMLKKAIVENTKEEDSLLTANLTLRKILGGDILNAQFVRRQIWLFVLIAGFMLLYVSNRYSCQKELLQIDKLTEELKDAKYRALSSNSLVTEKCRESHILEMLKNNADSTLHIPNQPPYIINVPNK